MITWLTTLLLGSANYIQITLIAIFTVVNLYVIYRLMGVTSIEIVPILTGASASVIVPVRNNPNGVARIIETLCKSNHELIIVDDESTDDTYVAAKYLCNKCGCRVIRVSKPPQWIGKPHACWRGYQISTQNFLVFLDSDTKIDIETIDTICSLLENYDAVSLLPRIKALTSISALFEYAFTILVWIFYTPWRIHKNGRVWLAGALMGWRREAYEKLGGHKRVYNKIIEDVMLAQAAFKEGYRIGFYSLKTYYTELDYSLKELYEFMKRVSLFVKINPIIFLLPGIMGSASLLVAIWSLLTLHTLVTAIYIVTLYIPPIYLYAKGYVRGKPYMILLYPLSYPLVSILGYAALKEIIKSEGKIKILWGDREIILHQVNPDTYSQYT